MQVKKIFFNPIFIILFSLIIFIIILSLNKDSLQNQVSPEEIANFKKQNQNLKNQIDLLEQELKNNNQEKIIRDELLMQKPGEYVVKVPEFEEVAPSPEPSPVSSPLEDWRRVFGI